jgi:hypothetical protein
MEKRKMLKRLLKNRKGTAEVIGSVLFIVILLFFFTNVYLWHDAATKDMNALHVKKMSASFTVTPDAEASSLTVKADGGAGISLSRLWIVDEVNGGRHLYADLGNVRVEAGSSFTIMFGTTTDPANPIDRVDTDPPLGNSITVHYAPQPGVKYKIVNTLGIIESPTS